MPIIFNSEIKREEFYCNQLSTSQISVDRLIETDETFDFENANMRFQNAYFDGFRVANNLTINKTSKFIYNIKNDIDTVKFYFNRTGRTKIGYDEFEKKFDVSCNRFNIIYSSELNTKMEHENGHSAMFSLQLTWERYFSLLEGNVFLKAFSERIYDKMATIFSEQWLSTSAQIDNCIDSIVACHLIKDMRRLFLQTKSIELLILLVNADFSKARDSFFKHGRDRDVIYEIKKYLEINYAHHTSLDSICKMFGINEFKLKAGFREVFNTSVINFVINKRLDAARILLAENKLNISEIAYHTGYSNPNYFSKAFKKKFGINPSMKNK